MMKKFVVGAMILSLLSSAGAMCFACEEADSVSPDQEIMTLEERDSAPVGEEQAPEEEQEKDECCEQHEDFEPRGFRGGMLPPPRRHHHRRREMSPPPHCHHHYRHHEGMMPPPPFPPCHHHHHHHHHHWENGPMNDRFVHDKCPNCGYDFSNTEE